MSDDIGYVPYALREQKIVGVVRRVRPMSYQGESCLALQIEMESGEFHYMNLGISERTTPGLTVEVGDRISLISRDNRVESVEIQPPVVATADTASGGDDLSGYPVRNFFGLVTSVHEISISGDSHMALQLAVPDESVMSFLVAAGANTVEAFNLQAGQWATVFLQKDRVINVVAQTEVYSLVSSFGSKELTKFKRREAILSVQGCLKVAARQLGGCFDFDVNFDNNGVIVVKVIEYFHSHGLRGKGRELELEAVASLRARNDIKAVHDFAVRFEAGTPG